MKKFLGFLAAFVLMFVSISISHAEGSPNETAKKYGISFPVAELGNCASVVECHQFCEDSSNHNVCVDFAKKKGFYKVSIFEAAKGALGCDSENSCKEVCGLQENWEKCGEFAKKYRLRGGQESPNKEEMLEKAKQFLGCTTYDECKSFCFRPENQEKCSQFSRMIATQSGQLAPGDQAFCTRYPEKCRNLNTGVSNQSIPDRTNCQNLKEKMGATASSIVIKAYYEKYCLQNNPAPTSPFPPITKDEYCKIYPEKCNYLTPSPKPTYDLETKCKSYPGCTWTGSVCQCSPTAATSTSTVKGVSTRESILQTIRHWLGF